jgi:hypothetical protein|tara:strand:- start:658 stop:789 length:132 start_codon:yes stop_codon:yes gene_type:complete
MAQDGVHIPSKKFRDNYSSIFRKKTKKKKLINKKTLKEQWQNV